MTNVVQFAEYYYIRCVTLERAEELEEQLQNHNCHGLASSKQAQMEKIFKDLYNFEKQKYYEGVKCFKK